MVQNLSYLVLILCNSQKVPLLEKQIYIEDNNDQRRILFKLSLYLILFNCQKVPLLKKHAYIFTLIYRCIVSYSMSI